MMRFGLLGRTLGHSFSKEIHEKLGRYSYELIEIEPDKLADFLNRRDFAGLNVTIPYKQSVIPCLDSISSRAQAIGAVNTIVNRDGVLLGDNTDYGGLKALILRTGLSLEKKTVLIAGSGGTSRTAMAVAGDLGASSISRLSRSGRDGAITYEDAYKRFPDAEILINTTPAGMYPDTGSTAVELPRLPKLEGVIDVVYNPLKTQLVRQAQERGIRAENGLYMLVAQAVLAAELFTGEQFGEELTEKIYQEIYAEKKAAESSL